MGAARRGCAAGISSPHLHLKEYVAILAIEMQNAAEIPVDPEAAHAVVTKAVRRVAEAVGVSQKELAQILGVSEATVSRFASGKVIDLTKKEGELALLFVRMFRSLDALVGSEAKARLWFHAHNDHLGGVPAERVRTVEGLVHVAEYLDAMRGQL
jgi:transcriptional regulator with XRE-family HTH domain